jgi:hypothetical protein
VEQENHMRAISLSCLGRLAGAALVAAPIAYALPLSALAKPGFAIVKLTAAAFVSNCQSMGGTSSSAPSGGIRCVLPSGTVVDCSFSNGEAICQWTRTMPPASVKQLMGDTPPDRMMSPGNSTTPPKVPGGSNSGGSNTVN